jgi:hypothetical protein
MIMHGIEDNLSTDVYLDGVLTTHAHSGIEAKSD